MSPHNFLMNLEARKREPWQIYELTVCTTEAFSLLTTHLPNFTSCP